MNYFWRKPLNSSISSYRYPRKNLKNTITKPANINYIITISLFVTATICDHNSNIKLCQLTKIARLLMEHPRILTRMNSSQYNHLIFIHHASQLQH
ncbi:hypothetical protein A471_10293 [Ectopseudomonas mendocina DLHK]|nr:hypothetical protein A471_10293 [Pseudomonas mendocina DLHK]